MSSPIEKCEVVDMALRVDGVDLVDSCGEPVQLRGVSSHGLQWYGDLYTRDNLTQLRDDFGINVFRVAVYVDPDDDGYAKNNSLLEKAVGIIDDCIELGLYVIVDWHVLNDKNPLEHIGEATSFFGMLSSRYANVPNVIYEICNEPNGDVDWLNHIKPYAETVVSLIRMHSPNAIVIVGTPDWSKELWTPANSPLADDNVMYAFHFYAGSHNKNWRDRIDEARESGLPVFVSECGATDATGDGDIYADAFGRWMDYLNEKKISWVYWSLSNKDEASAMLRQDYELSDGVRLTDYLTESGRLVREWLRK